MCDCHVIINAYYYYLLPKLSHYIQKRISKPAVVAASSRVKHFLYTAFSSYRDLTWRTMLYDLSHMNGNPFIPLTLSFTIDVAIGLLLLQYAHTKPMPRCASLTGLTKNRPHDRTADCTVCWKATARPRRRPHSNTADALCGVLHVISKITRHLLNREQIT